MLYRTVDENGDMMPIRKKSELSSGADAVALAVDARLAMLYGEWWEDRSLGFKVPRFLALTVRTHKANMLARYIGKYISATKGVTGLIGTQFYVSPNPGHEMEFSTTILTKEGTTSVEVTEDGILRAVY